MRWNLLTLSLLVGCKNDQETVAEGLSAASSPVLSVSTPERASWNAQGAATMTGNISEIDTILVNGEAHAVSGASFAVPVDLARGINTFETEAISLDGKSLFDRRSVLAGSFAPAEGDITGAVGARVNQGGLDDGAEIVAGMVDAQSINKSIGALNPVVDLEYSLGTGISVDLNSVFFDAPMVDLIAGDGALAVEVILPDLLVDADADASVLWIDSEHNLELTASYAVVSADLTLGLQDGVVVAGLENTVVALENFAYDVSLLPGDFIEDNVFSDTIREAIEERLAGEMQTLLPEAITSLQEGLDLSFKTELLGTAVDLGAGFSDIGVDGGGVWVGLDLTVDAGGTDLSGDGYLTGGMTLPEADTTADAAVMMADDVINRAMYELWLGGVLSQTLSTADGSLSPDALSSFGLTEATVTTDAALPPVLVGTDGGGMALQLGEVTVALETPSFSLGNSLVVRVAGSVGLGLSYSDGAVAPQLSDVGLSFDIVETDWEQDQEAIVNLLESFITPDLLLGAVDGLALELPSLDGLSIDNATVTRADSGVHSDLRLDISAN